MADETPTPPDDLKPRGSSDQDANFVTEELAAMKAPVHRVLAAWFVILGTAAIVGLVSYWPPPDEDQEKHGASAESVVTKTTNLSAPADSIGATDAAKHSLRNPAGSVTSANADTTESKKKRPFTRDQEFFLVALLCGLLGGSIHGLSSLMDYRGERRLFRSWSLWYFGQPIIGGFLAFVVFLLFRAGLLNASSLASKTINPFGVGALCALTGLFTDKVTNKLVEVLDTVFNTASKREGQLNPPKPPKPGGANE